MNKRINSLSILTFTLVSSSVFLYVPQTKAGPSARAIRETGEVIGNWFRRNSDNIYIPIPRKFRVTGKTVEGVRNFLVRGQDGKIYCVGQAQYSDGSYSELYYSEPSSCSQ